MQFSCHQPSLLRSIAFRKPKKEENCPKIDVLSNAGIESRQGRFQARCSSQRKILLFPLKNVTAKKKLPQFNYLFAVLLNISLKKPKLERWPFVFYL